MSFVFSRLYTFCMGRVYSFFFTANRARYFQFTSFLFSRLYTFCTHNFFSLTHSQLPKMIGYQCMQIWKPNALTLSISPLEDMFYNASSVQTSPLPVTYLSLHQLWIQQMMMNNHLASPPMSTRWGLNRKTYHHSSKHKGSLYSDTNNR